jgi:predicted Zn-dependent protease
VRLLALAFMDGGQLDRARKLLEEKRGAMEHNYLWRHAWALLLVLEGKKQEALDAMDEATLKFAEIQILTTLETAEFFAMMGDRARAFEWLDRAVKNGDERVNWFQKDPRLASIRDDPRFQRIIASVQAGRKQKH